MAHFRYSPAAVADLDGIWTYTVERWGIAQAEFYVRELDETCQFLADGVLPGIDASDIRNGYFKQFTGRHVVYFHRATSDGLVVIRILHQAMDATTRLTEQ